MSGGAFIFRKNDRNKYEEITELTPLDGAYNFGRSVAIGNGRIAVGAVHINATGEEPGFVYVYKYDNNGSWFLATILDSSNDPKRQDMFGSELAIDNDQIAIAAPKDGRYKENTFYVSSSKQNNKSNTTFKIIEIWRKFWFRIRVPCSAGALVNADDRSTHHVSKLCTLDKSVRGT